MCVGENSERRLVDGEGVFLGGETKKAVSETQPFLLRDGEELCVLHFVNDGFERSGVVHSEVSEDLAVDFDTSFVDEAHEF
jgi:hypothetical protein